MSKIQKAKMGRPSKYRPEYCQKLITHMAKGFSFETFGVDIDVCEDTLYHWVKQYPDFSEAKKKARKSQLMFFQKLSVAAMTGQIKNFNATVWIFCMKNYFGWRDAVDIQTEARAVLKVITSKGMKKYEV